MKKTVNLTRVVKNLNLAFFLIVVFLYNPAIALGAEEYVFETKWGKYGNEEGCFIGPWGIAVNKNNEIYVVDAFNFRVQKFDLTGNFITKWGNRGNGEGQFQSPRGIAIDQSGNVYVVDLENFRVQKFDSNGNFITKWGTYGTGTGQFMCPLNIATDKDNNIYVVDYKKDCVQKFDSVGNFIMKWDLYTNGNGMFTGPVGIAVDSNNNVYVTDTQNHMIHKYDTNGTLVSKFGSFGTGDGCFNFPSGIATDGENNVYVSDSLNSRIQKFNSSGEYVTKWGSPGTNDGLFGAPMGLTVDKSGSVYVNDPDNVRVQKFRRKVDIDSCNQGQTIIIPVTNANPIPPVSYKHGWSVRAGVGTKLSFRAIKSVEVQSSQVIINMARDNYISSDETVQVKYIKPSDPDKALVDVNGRPITLSFSVTLTNTSMLAPPRVDLEKSCVEKSGVAVKVYYDNSLDTKRLKGINLTQKHGWTVKRAAVESTAYAPLKITSVDLGTDYVVLNVFDDARNRILNGESVKVAYKVPTDLDKKIKGANGIFADGIVESTIGRNGSGLYRPVLPDFTDKSVNYCVYNKVYLRFGHVGDGSYSAVGWTVKEGSRVIAIQELTVNDGLAVFSLASNITDNKNVSVTYVVQKTGSYMRSSNAEGAVQIAAIPARMVYWKGNP